MIERREEKGEGVKCRENAEEEEKIVGNQER